MNDASRALFLMFLATIFLIIQRGAVAQEIEFGRHHALLIANENYRHWPDLRTPSADVAALRRVLDQKYDFESIRVLSDVSRDEVLHELDGLVGRLHEEDNLLIYYAGHGEIRGGRGYWIGVDGETDRRAGWISDLMLSQLLSEMQARHVLVIADSCYSGVLLRDLGDVGVAQEPGEDRRAWLQKITIKRARSALTSGGLSPVVDSSGDEEHSVFAEELLRALRNNTEVIEAQALHEIIKAPVAGKAFRIGLEQEPDYGAIHAAAHEGGDFLFVPKGTALAAVSPGTAGNGSNMRGNGVDDTMLRAWESTERIGTMEAYRAFVDGFCPGHAFCAIAEAQITRLERESDPRRPDALQWLESLYSAGGELISIKSHEDIVRRANLREFASHSFRYPLCESCNFGFALECSSRVRDKNDLFRRKVRLKSNVAIMEKAKDELKIRPVQVIAPEVRPALEAAIIDCIGNAVNFDGG